MDSRVKELSALLTGYSCALKPGEKVLIDYEGECSKPLVRQLIKENRMEEMHGLVPESTYSYFISDVGRETAEKIRGCADVVHY